MIAALDHRNAWTASTSHGYALLRRSPWDTDVLMRSTVVVEGAFLADNSPENAAALLTEISRRLIAEDADFAVWRIGAGIDWFETRLIEFGWRRADGMVVFLDTPTDSRRQGAVRPIERGDESVLRDVAALALRHGRIQDDPEFSPVVRARFIDALAESSLRHPETLVAVDAKERPVGFVSGRADAFASAAVGGREGSLGLIAIAPQATRQGLGRALYGAFMSNMSRHRIERVEISTQHENRPAAALYRGAGARVAGGIATFHWHRASARDSS
jgi:ribosomal protein S18 acetylase RimI-like enzyme